MKMKKQWIGNTLFVALIVATLAGVHEQSTLLRRGAALGSDVVAAHGVSPDASGILERLTQQVKLFLAPYQTGRQADSTTAAQTAVAVLDDRLFDR